MHTTASNESSVGPDVIIVANFVSPPSIGNNRFLDLAQRLTALGARIELVTSSFAHYSLSPREHSLEDLGFKVTLVDEPGYRKNISVERLISQRRFSKNITRYLRERDAVPDLIYCATPPPGVARACANYATRKEVPFIVDIQDLWPEAFAMHFPLPEAIHMIFRSMIRSSRIAYREADLVVAVSETYITHAEKIAKITPPSSVVFLGSTLRQHLTTESSQNDFNTKPKAQIAYVGTLSHSYDLPLIIDAIALLVRADKKYSELELIVLGDGPRRREFEQYSIERGVKATFHGRVPHHQMLRKLSSATVAVNPIITGSWGSVINKVGDYAAAGLPVVNTRESPEYRALLEAYSAGFNCRNGDPSDVAQAIKALLDDPDLAFEMGCNNRQMAEDLFDRDKTYNALARRIMSLAEPDAE